MISILILFKIFLGMDQTPGEVYTLAKVFFDVSRVRWGVFGPGAQMNILLKTFRIY